MEEASARYISIHAPREGGDRIIRGVDKFTIRFQSTPPARGATRGTTPARRCSTFQSTPPARGATRLMMFHEIDGKISIHAPREGGDSMGKAIKIVNTDFNPRPPRGGRPGWITGTAAGLGISIHAPREGGDILYGCTAYFSWYFNPRPPRGGRRYYSVHCFPDSRISIHAPREGGDSKDAQFYL